MKVKLVPALAITTLFLTSPNLAPAEDDAPASEEKANGSDSAAPTTAELEEAKAAFGKGKTFFDSGELLNAAKMFKLSYRLSRNPILLYNIGFTTDRLGKTELAIFYYEKFLKEAPAEAPNRDLAEERMAEIRTQAEKATKKAEREAARAAKRKKRRRTPAKADQFEHNIIEEAPPGMPLDVTAAIPKNVDWRVTVYYRLPGVSAYTAVPMRRRYAELVGRIAAAATKRSSSLQYYVEARSGSELIARSGKPTSPHLITIDEGAKARYYPDLDETGVAPGAVLGSANSPSDERPKNFWLKWGTTGGATLGIVLGVTFYALSADASSTLEGEATASTITDACPNKPCRTYSKTQSDLEDKGKRYETLGHVTLGLGVATAAVAGYFWYKDIKGDSKEDDGPEHYNPDTDNPLSRVDVAPMITPDFVGGAALIEF